MKVGPLSVASFFFLLLSVLSPAIEKRGLFLYFAGLMGLISLLFSYLPYDSNLVQYRLSFPIISLLFLLAWSQWLNIVEKSTNMQVIQFACYAALVFTLLSISTLTPDSLFQAIDGSVGFFNEKGIQGQYLVIVGFILYFSSPTRLNLFLFVIVLMYSTFILESGRALVFCFAVFSLLWNNLSKLRKFCSLAVLILLFCFSFLLNAPFLTDQYDKILLLFYGEHSLVGRYAAAFLIRESNIIDLLFGHGFGSYLRQRAVELPLFDLEYDYPGSVIFELIYEVGLIATLVIVMMITYVNFRVFGVTFLIAVICSLFFGVKHDVTVFFSLIALQFINHRLIYFSNR